MLFKVKIIQLTISDYPVIQNMARFYVYDLSKSCGFISKDWAIPHDGLYECIDFKNYFEDPTRKAFLLKINDELAGFVLLNKIGTDVKTDWNMGEFFILGKFQEKGIGKQVAYQIWDIHNGKWEVSVIPENLPALSFWKKTINLYTKGDYKKDMKLITYDEDQPNRIIFSFKS